MIEEGLEEVKGICKTIQIDLTVNDQQYKK